MKVIILTSIAGHADQRYDLADFSFRPGEEAELHDFLASAWVQSGIARLADPADAALLLAIEEAPDAKVLGFDVSELASKKKADLVAFAKERFGLELSASLRKEDILASILKRAESESGSQSSEPVTTEVNSVEAPAQGGE